MLKNIDKTSKVLIIVLVLALMVTYVVYTSYVYTEKNDYSFINDYFNKIGNNYDLDINNSINYSKDDNIEIIKSDYFNFNKEYIGFNNKFYIRDNDKFKEMNITTDIDNRYYYDIDLIKNLIKYCEYSTFQNRSINCSISSENYNNELIVKYGITPLKIDNISFDFYISNDMINVISAVYDKDKYTIMINNINGNDYSKIVEVIK